MFEIINELNLEYPRPQMVRKSWMDLNGVWDFHFDKEDKGEREKWYLNKKFQEKIVVPFVYQSELSGIGRKEHCDVVWYKRNLKLNKVEEKNYFINFESCDYITKLWVNGELAGMNKGGHVPFSFEISKLLKDGENTLVVRVEDKNLCTQPIGKQSWKEANFLCWYTRTTGIWQPVWLEEVNKHHIKEFKMTPDIENSHINIELETRAEVSGSYLEAEVYFWGELIRRASVNIKNNRAKLSIDVGDETPDFRLHYWTPDTPNLYDIRFILKKGDEIFDTVNSYFGMRSIECEGHKVLLNNQEFYQKLILDQGYFGKGLMTPSSPEQLADDLIKTKEMGFNGVRKHQKIEDRRYMHLCDKLGLVMWAEMPSPFEFSDETMENMMNESREMIKKHWNHPSVIVYTLMNESWGVNEIYKNKKQQSFVNTLYHMTKTMDSSRIIIGNDGWEHTLTDILSIHDYNSNADSLYECWKDMAEAVNGMPSVTSRKKNYANGYKYDGQPVMISEYGGIAFSEDSSVEAWGYGDRPKSKEEVLERLNELTKAIMDIDYLCGFCYTQLTDVEQEVNGLLDHEHNYKFDPKKLKKILGQKHNKGFIFE